MTYDNTNQKLISYRFGEKKPLYGTLTGLSGTEVITNPQFTLYNASGGIVLGPTGALATAPGLSTQMYYSLDTALNGILAGNWYYGAFSAVDTPSADGIARNVLPTLAIWVAPIVEATYVLGTPIGDLRQAIADTNVVDPVFSDPELTNFLTQAGGQQAMAAWRALIAQSTDRSKLAISINTGGWGTTQSAVYKALMELADKFYRYRSSPVVVPVTKALFTLGNSDLGTVGTLDQW